MCAAYARWLTSTAVDEFRSKNRKFQRNQHSKHIRFKSGKNQFFLHIRPDWHFFVAFVAGTCIWFCTIAKNARTLTDGQTPNAWPFSPTITTSSNRFRIIFNSLLLTGFLDGSFIQTLSKIRSMATPIKCHFLEVWNIDRS